MLYVFMPPIKCWRRKVRAIKKKLNIGDPKRRSDLNYDGKSSTQESYTETEDYTDDDSDYEDSAGGSNPSKHQTKCRKNKDSFLGDLEADNSSISDDDAAAPEQQQKKHGNHQYMGNYNFVSANQTND